MTITRNIGSLLGLCALVFYRQKTAVGLIVQETYNMVKIKIGDKYLLFPKDRITLLLNASKIKGKHLKGLAWHRLKG